MPIEVVALLILVSCVLIVVVPWMTIKSLIARSQQRAAELAWAEAGERADALVDLKLDEIGPLAGEELQVLFRAIVWETLRSGSVTGQELRAQVGWARRVVRAHAERESEGAP